MKTKDINQQAFFELVKTGLWGNGNPDIRIDGATDWQEVYRLATEQSVLGLVLDGLEHSDEKPPQIMLLQWIGEVQVIEQQNKEMNAFIAELIEKLRKNDADALLVKGQGVAQCYEKPLWRCSGDVDLFLSDSNYEIAKRVLVPLASEVETEYVGSKHLGMTIDGWVVELHGSLRVGLPNRINRVLDDIRQDTFYGGNVRSWNNNRTQVFLLGKENDVVYVFVHFLNHFYKGGIGLRQICDWCRLLWIYKGSLDYGLIESRIRKMGLMSEWKAFATFAVKYLGMSVEAMPFLNEDDKQNEKLNGKAERIKNFILMSGNFGHNRDMSYYEKYPYMIRKFYSMKMRVGDLISHARIFPMDSLRFFPRIMWNGVVSAVRGEG